MTDRPGCHRGLLWALLMETLALLLALSVIGMAHIFDII